MYPGSRQLEARTGALAREVALTGQQQATLFLPFSSAGMSSASLRWLLLSSIGARGKNKDKQETENFLGSSETLSRSSALADSHIAGDPLDASGFRDVIEALLGKSQGEYVARLVVGSSFAQMSGGLAWRPMKHCPPPEQVGRDEHGYPAQGVQKTRRTS